MSAPEHPTIAAAKAREERSPRAARRARGVVHTPMELARFGLGKLHGWLQEDFRLAQGIADPGALLLDPAVGTGVWLAAALEQGAPGVPRQGLLAPALTRSMWGFDVDEGVLETTRALLSPALALQGVALALRCENTLAIEDPWPRDRAGVRVIVGNPPWAARSLSRGTALSDAWLADFRRDASGRALGERRVGVLSDDYVRFFRWTLQQVRTAPQGALVCLATNASFLDGPVHRGMRAALRSSFDRIDVIDLGGNALLARGSERDENVFGVRVGAALTLGIRLPGAHERHGRVRVARARGTREHKLRTLPDLAWSEVAEDLGAAWSVIAGRAVGRPRRAEFSLAEAFPFHREGVQTNRDELATASTREALVERMERVADGSYPLLARAHFDPERARAMVREVIRDAETACIRRLAYRPLDTRFVFAAAPLCHRPRPDLLRAMDHSRLSLLSVRKDRGSLPFSLFAAATEVADACYLSTRSSCRTRVFPSHTPDGSPNLSPQVRNLFESSLDAVEPEQVIHYALGVLCSARFRQEQGESLKQDYPRIFAPQSAACAKSFAIAGRLAIDALYAPLDEIADGRVRAWEPGEEPEVGSRQACFMPQTETVVVAGKPVIRGVSLALWNSAVGHTSWRRLALDQTHGTTRGMLNVLRRAELWLNASERADEAFLRHFT